MKRQQLLDQAKSNNIFAKPFEGLNLHAQVESQLKQDKDAKALLEKALLPLLTETTLHRVELVPETIEQPNPTIDKKKTNDYFVTFDFKVNLSIDKNKYYQYVSNNLLPVLNQLADEVIKNVAIT